MIPPADGLTENELGLFVNILNSLNDEGFVIYTFIQRGAFKSLEDLGVIGVATVREIAWGNSGPTKDYFKVWVTEKGHKYMRGEVNVAKHCNLHDKYMYNHCKRHKRAHTLEERKEAGFK